MSDVTTISDALFNKVAELASASSRLRMNYNFHSSANDSAQRFLNVLLRGTYIRPHRHLVPPKFESFLVLEGEADVLLFDNDGRIVERHQLGVS